ncbi:hypothetical protein ACFL2Q_08155 [Thermodesulfobacteriota bacterium]
MTRDEMLCKRCIKFDGRLCRSEPEPVPIEDPGHHWCAQGHWQQWSDRYQEMEPFYWGEWED